MKPLSLKARVKLVESSIDYVTAFRTYLPQLKRCGSNLKCKSPFTEERTASFIVNPRKQIWKCFSTGKGGKSIISFVAQVNDLTFVEALAWVETKFGLSAGKRDTKTMSRMVKVLEKQTKHVDTEYMDEQIKKAYENRLLKLTRKIYERCGDDRQLMMPFVDYVWSEFDDRQFINATQFEEFFLEGFRFLRHIFNHTVLSVQELKAKN